MSGVGGRKQSNIWRGQMSKKSFLSGGTTLQSIMNVMHMKMGSSRRFKQYLPGTPSSTSLTLDSPRVLLAELRRHKDTVRCAALGLEVPVGVDCQEQLTQILTLHFSSDFFCCFKYRKSARPHGLGHFEKPLYN